MGKIATLSKGTEAEQSVHQELDFLLEEQRVFKSYSLLISYDMEKISKKIC